MAETLGSIVGLWFVLYFVAFFLVANIVRSLGLLSLLALEQKVS